MAIEFMAGATVFALINILISIPAILSLYSLSKKAIKFYVEENVKLKIKTEIFVLGLCLLFVIFIPGSMQPKVTIDTPVNRDLIEYQTDKEVEIVTPPPRTEKLEGFTPLKK